MFTDIGFQIAIYYIHLPIVTQKIIFVLVFAITELIMFLYLKYNLLKSERTY